MRPKIIVHNEMSLDNRITGFDLDMDRYYGIAAEFGADGVIAGSETVVTAVPEIPPETEKGRPETFNDASIPWFFIIDSGGRVRSHHVFRELPFIRDVVVLVCRSTPDEYIEYMKERNIGYIQTGDQKVDLIDAFERIGVEYSVKKLRVDSGGALNSKLFENGLVDEISMIIDPVLVGGEGPTEFGDMVLDGPLKLELKKFRELDDGCIHLIYEKMK